MFSGLMAPEFFPSKPISQIRQCAFRSLPTCEKAPVTIERYVRIAGGLEALDNTRTWPRGKTKQCARRRTSRSGQGHWNPSPREAPGWWRALSHNHRDIELALAGCFAPPMANEATATTPRSRSSDCPVCDFACPASAPTSIALGSDILNTPLAPALIEGVMENGMVVRSAVQNIRGKLRDFLILASSL